MPTPKLKDYLDRHHIKYVTIWHSPAVTAQEIAASAHISGKDLAKTVVIKIDGKLALAVLPASYQIDLAFLKEQVGGERVELAVEEEFQKVFPESELGAMPPFGNLYGLEVYASKSLIEEDEIAFNAGSHSELIQMAVRDFERLVEPIVLEFEKGGAAV